MLPGQTLRTAARNLNFQKKTKDHGLHRKEVHQSVHTSKALP